MKPPVFRSPRKRKGAGAERREEILAAALRLFGERGVHAVSTRQIAEATGISQPALYAYFATKDDIALELTLRVFAMLRTRVAEAMAARPLNLETLDLFMRVYVDFGLENPDAYRVAFMIEDGKPHEPPGDQGLEAGMAAFNELRTAVLILHGQGLMVDEDVEVLTQNIWATLHGLVSLLIARPTFPWAERETLIASHLRMLRRAVLKY